MAFLGAVSVGAQALYPLVLMGGGIGIVVVVRKYGPASRTLKTNAERQQDSLREILNGDRFWPQLYKDHPLARGMANNNVNAQNNNFWGGSV